jgi:hypothetical protein
MWSYLFNKIYSDDRMSNSPSLLSKLKNKITYQINKVVDDPEANKFAEERKKEQDNNPSSPLKLESEKDKRRRLANDFFSKNRDFVRANIEPLIDTHLRLLADRLRNQKKTEPEINKAISIEYNRVIKLLEDEIVNGKTPEQIMEILQTDFNETDDPSANKFSPKRVGNKILDYLKLIFNYTFMPFLSLIFSSLIANEMIVYRPEIRFIFFMFTFLLCTYIKPIILLLGFYYLCKLGYSYYVNNMSGGPKERIMPTLFAILPLMTNPSKNGTINTLLTPFLYGKAKSMDDFYELKERMDEYKKSLDEAFPYLQKVKNQEPWESGIKKIDDLFERLHFATDVPNVSENSPPLPPQIETTKESKNKFNQLHKNSPLPPTISKSIEASKEESKENPPLPPTISKSLEETNVRTTASAAAAAASTTI